MKTEHDEIEVRVRISVKDYDDMVAHFEKRARGKPLVGVIEYAHQPTEPDSFPSITHSAEDERRAARSSTLPIRTLLPGYCEVTKPNDGIDQS